MAAVNARGLSASWRVNAFAIRAGGAAAPRRARGAAPGAASRGPPGRAANVLEPRARGEDADAERVLEGAPAAAARDELGDLHAVERIDARGLAELGLVDGVAGLHRRRRRRRRVEHLLPARAVVVAARRGALARVNRGVLGGAAELLGRALDALGQQVAEALALADHLDQPVGALNIAPLEVEAHLLRREPPLFEALHHPAAHPAELVDVQAGAIELCVEPRHAVDVGGDPDRPAGARPALVLRLVHHLALVRPLADDGHVAVVHAAGVALVAAVVEALAQLGRLPLRHVGVGGVRRVVLDRQGAELVEVHHAGQRAVLVERAHGGIGLEVVGDLVGGLHDAARVVDRERPGALHDRDALQLLLAHDGAHAVLGGDVAVVALNRREPREVLTGRADRVHRELVAAHAEVGAERVLGVPRVLADVGLGVAELDTVVVDVEVDPVAGLALDDDGVVAAVLQIRPEEAVGLCGRRAVGAGADGDDGETAGAPHRQPGQRAGGEDQAVVGGIPRHVALPLARLLVDDARAGAHAAELIAHLGRAAPRLAPALALGQIDAEDLAGESAGQRGLWLRGLLGSARHHWSHTATGESP